MLMSLLYSIEHALSHFMATAQRLDKCYLMLSTFPSFRPLPVSRTIEWRPDGATEEIFIAPYFLLSRGI